MVGLGYVIVYVEDVPKTIAFYERAFGLEVRFVHESNTYGELQTGSTVLGFASHELGRANLPDGYCPVAPDGKPVGMEIAFVVEDVPATCDRAVAAGAVLLMSAKAKPWGQIVAYLRGIEGTLIEVCTPAR